MVRRMWLFGLILAVPLLGMAVAAGVEWTFDSELRTAAQRQAPDADPEQVAALKFSSLCPSSEQDLQDACDTYDRITTLGGVSAVAGLMGVGLIGILWIAGIAASANRNMLLVVFRPGLYLTGAVLIVLVVMHAGIAIASIYYGESALSGRIHVGLILAIAVGAAGGAIAIAKNAFAVVRTATTGVIGLALTKTEAPGLWQKVEEVADRLNALPPNNIVVGLDPNFFVTEAEVRHLRGTCTGRTLYCSLPLSRILATPEFVGIVGHELAHFKGLDTRFSHQFFPIYRGTTDAIHALQQMSGEGSGVVALLPAIALFGYFLECFAVAESKISRERELVADRAGVEVSSSTAMGSALVKVHAYSGVWDDVTKEAFALLKEGQIWVNASITFAGAVRHGAQRGTLEGIAETQMPHPTDSHPPLSVRLDALGVSVESLTTEALNVEPENAAITLLTEPERVEEQVSQAYQAILRQYVAGHPQAETMDAAAV